MCKPGNNYYPRYDNFVQIPIIIFGCFICVFICCAFCLARFRNRSQMSNNPPPTQNLFKSKTIFFRTPIFGSLLGPPPLGWWFPGGGFNKKPASHEHPTHEHRPVPLQVRLQPLFTHRPPPFPNVRGGGGGRRRGVRRGRLRRPGGRCLCSVGNDFEFMCSFFSPTLLMYVCTFMCTFFRQHY